MKKGRFKRNLLAIIGWILTFLFSFIKFKLNPSSLNNFSDIMSASLSFAALATALFFSCFSLIPAFSNSKFINALQEIGTDKKIMDRLLITTIIFFIVSVFSFIALFFDETSSSLESTLVISLWVSFVVAGCISTFQILSTIMVGFNYFTKEED